MNLQNPVSKFLKERERKQAEKENERLRRLEQERAEEERKLAVKEKIKLERIKGRDKDPVYHFNKGNTLYDLLDFRHAVEEYSIALRLTQFQRYRENIDYRISEFSRH